MSLKLLYLITFFSDRNFSSDLLGFGVNSFIFSQKFFILESKAIFSSDFDFCSIVILAFNCLMIL